MKMKEQYTNPLGHIEGSHKKNAYGTGCSCLKTREIAQ